MAPPLKRVTAVRISQIANAGASRIVLAVPVGPPDAVEDLENLADAVVCLATPASFRAVGQAYRNFEQVTDEEAMAYLDRES